MRSRSKQGLVEPAHFPVFIDGAPVFSRVKSTLPGGSHRVSETSDPGYVASAWRGDCDANGSISLSPGVVKAGRREFPGPLGTIRLLDVEPILGVGSAPDLGDTAGPIFVPKEVPMK